MVINRLRLFRLKIGMTQKELAQAIGCSQTFISLIECGKAKYVSRGTMEKLRGLGYDGQNPREIIACPV